MTTIKYQVLEKLSLIQDIPEEDDLLFGFKKYAEQIKNIIVSEDTTTPFTIALHGDWGSGKTSLILEIEKQVKSDIEHKNDWHVIKFDAWEYERVDIVAALFQKIESEYRGKSGKIADFSNSVGMLLADIGLRRGVGMSLEDATNHFRGLINEIPNIKTNIENLTTGGRLIIFVDDLDRCHIDNVLDMLEAIKMFLTANNVLFVIAVDMTKIERAWKLRYKSEDGSTEGKEHVEKIFPLRLSLPEKNTSELTKYVSKMCESLSQREQELIIKGCPSNPRKIKRIVNLVYFVLKNLDDDNDFDKKVPFVIIWCILTSVYPKFTEIIKKDLISLFQLVVLVTHSGNFEDLLEILDKPLSINSNKNLNLAKKSFPGSWLNHYTKKGLEHVLYNEPELEKLLRQIGVHFSVEGNKSEDWGTYVRKISAQYYDTLKPFQDVIYHSSLIGG